MAEKTTFDRVRAIVIDHLDQDPDKVTVEADLVELGCDSLDHVELIMAFEEEFDIEIMDEKAEGVKTIGDAVKLIDELVAAKA